MTSSRPTFAYVLLTLTALFWSGNFVLARAMHAAVPPMALSFGRWLIALALLAPLALAPFWRSRHLLWAQRGRVLLSRRTVSATIGLTGRIISAATLTDARPILDRLLLGEPHGLHSLDPQGGVDMAEMKRLVGGRVCLIGNVNCGLLDTGTDEECVESARYALRLIKRVDSSSTPFKLWTPNSK